MSNYLEGELEIAVSKKTPINILNMFYYMDKIFDVNKTFSKLIEESGIEELQQYITDDECLNPFPEIEFCMRLEKDKGWVEHIDEFVELDWNKYIENDEYEYFVIYIDLNHKQKYYERLDKIIESYIQILKPYNQFPKDNYIGYIYDEEDTPKKEYYFDREDFYKSKKETEYLCKGCKELNPEVWCIKHKLCERAYKLGCKHQFETDLKLIDLNELDNDIGKKIIGEGN